MDHILVFGGKGGVGKSSISTATAVYLAKQLKDKKILIGECDYPFRIVTNANIYKGLFLEFVMAKKIYLFQEKRYSWGMQENRIILNKREYGEGGYGYQDKEIHVRGGLKSLADGLAYLHHKERKIKNLENLEKTILTIAENNDVCIRRPLYEKELNDLGKFLSVKIREIKNSEDMGDTII